VQIDEVIADAISKPLGSRLHFGWDRTTASIASRFAGSRGVDVVENLRADRRLTITESRGAQQMIPSVAKYGPSE